MKGSSVGHNEFNVQLTSTFSVPDICFSAITTFSNTKVSVPVLPLLVQVLFSLIHLSHFYSPFRAYAMFINETPGHVGNLTLISVPTSDNHVISGKTKLTDTHTLYKAAG